MDAFNQLLQKTGEYGVVSQVSHPIVFIDGLPMVKTHEVILFETGQKGEVFSITRGKVEARNFSHDPVRVGTRVTRTDQLLSVPVGKELLGHTINPLGEPLDPAVVFTPPKEMRDVESKFIGIAGRQKITKPLLTGISLVDLMVPLGMGQRELIIGDRKTGKTSLLMTTIKKQAYEGVIAIYAAIAKKKSDIKRLQEFFEQEKIMGNMIIVATSSYDSPSLIYQTPYAAMAIAEYFRDEGIPTLVILDDLSTHAKFYRELSLLARRFPGRDSYPGDIFYTHSRLLERAGNFKHPKVGEVSITCLPVIEIVEGDFTGYIATNVMGITDGHIYLDTNIYYQGMRPAVNVPLSVTRVGRQTLDKLSREINKDLSAFLAQFTKLQNISHFGQELTADVKKKLNQGDLVNKFFNQPYQLTVPKSVQLIIISMIFQDLIQTKEDLDNMKAGLISASYDRGHQKTLFDISNTKDIKEFYANVVTNKDVLLAFARKTEATDTVQNPASPASSATTVPVQPQVQSTQPATATQPVQTAQAAPVQPPTQAPAPVQDEQKEQPAAPPPVPTATVEPTEKTVDNK
ncbi:MAG TPA: F0F1 ATP synthase subunit alpha [Candidatus Eisenbacteria bacterium]|nr:F0F1 ATP synthase subunit alpha [Candidatus Eisenbacteria bacterium]